jgi:phage FluMu protein Com
MAGVMRVECAWCKKVMREGDPAIVSHGICPECAKIAKAAKKTEKANG